MNDKYKDLQIDDVCFAGNSNGYGCLILNWSGSLGWGEFRLGINPDDDKIEYFMDSECMDKEFCMALLEKLYDKCEGGK